MCLANLHSFSTLTKFYQICYIRQNRQIHQHGRLPCVLLICIYLGIWRNFVKFVTVMTGKISSKLPNSPLPVFLDISEQRVFWEQRKFLFLYKISDKVILFFFFFSFLSGSVDWRPEFGTDGRKVGLNPTIVFWGYFLLDLLSNIVNNRLRPNLIQFLLFTYIHACVVRSLFF